MTSWESHGGFLPIGSGKRGNTSSVGGAGRGAVGRTPSGGSAGNSFPGRWGTRREGVTGGRTSKRRRGNGANVCGCPVGAGASLGSDETGFDGRTAGNGAGGWPDWLKSAFSAAADAARLGACPPTTQRLTDTAPRHTIAATSAGRGQKRARICVTPSNNEAKGDRTPENISRHAPDAFGSEVVAGRRKDYTLVNLIP